MDANLGSRKSLKNTLNRHLNGIKISLALENEFVWKDNKKIVVKVVAIMANASKVTKTFRKCIDIFSDADLLGLGNKELIPFPRKGVISLSRVDWIVFTR